MNGIGKPSIRVKTPEERLKDENKKKLKAENAALREAVRDLGERS